MIYQAHELICLFQVNSSKPTFLFKDTPLPFFENNICTSWIREIMAYSTLTGTQSEVSLLHFMSNGVPLNIGNA
jgi:hypothetical protein